LNKSRATGHAVDRNFGTFHGECDTVESDEKENREVKLLRARDTLTDLSHSAQCHVNIN